MNDLKIKHANESHLDFLFNLANDNLTRKFSFNQNTISYLDHSVWYKNKLSSKNDILYVCYDNNDLIGQIRFEIINELESVISISILHKYRGLGYGSQILKLGCIEFWKNYKIKILAYVKEINKNSYNLFLKNGFTLIENLNIKGDITYLLKKEYERN
jgi:UDP-2,4-diacetamido-2,4,6-trideoxy-beta-L-altropyranose hydrolase